MSIAIAMQQDTSAPLGIIAGSGHLPRQLVESCRKTGRDVFIVAVENEANPEAVEGVPHVWVRLGAVGVAIEHMKQAGVQDVVLAGKINRPSVAGIRPDAMGAKLMAKMGFAYFGGDVALLKAIIAFFEEEGFRVLGIEDVVHDLTAPEGPLTQHLPDKHSQKDIELGASIIRAIGMFDIGQAVLLKNGQVLGIEGAEGTDALIERCGHLRGEGKGGVLVKARKPTQEQRADLPTIGVRTIELVHGAGFAGIAIEAHHSLIVGRREVVQLADNLGIFIIGFSLQE